MSADGTAAGALSRGARAAVRVPLLQKTCAEMIGTFALVFAGCGAIMADHASGGSVTHLGVGLVFGLVVMVMIYAVGHISGAHFNPAVTLAFASTGRLPWRQVPAYVAGQVAAAVAAALVLRALLGPVAEVGATAPAGGMAQSLALEAVLSFFLMFVITAVATDARAVGQMAGLAIGGTVALAAVFGGPISGASMNPARSIGPAVAALGVDGWRSLWDVLWIYAAGPIAGAAMGAWAYRLVRCGGDEHAAPAAGGCC